MEIDNAIQQIERLYHSITGKNPPPVGDTPFAPIPPEANAQRFVEDRLNQLLALMNSRQPQPGQTNTWTPPMTVWETEKEVVVSFELAGVPRDAVEVSVVEKLLVVTGRRDEPWGRDNAQAHPHVNERPFGMFSRTVPLPPTTVPDKLAAEMKNGVLEVHIPMERKNEPVKQTIPVK